MLESAPLQGLSQLQQGKAQGGLRVAGHLRVPVPLVQGLQRRAPAPSLPQTWQAELFGDPLINVYGDEVRFECWNQSANVLRFMAERGIGLFYFVLQPTSDDTGGILKADWETPEDAKLDMLDVLPSTDVEEVLAAVR